MSSPAQLRWRRLFVAIATLVTIVIAIAWMAHVLGADGLTGLDLAMLVAFGLTMPVVALGSWSALIGFLILRCTRDPLANVLPALRNVSDQDPIESRVAIVMPVFNESPEQIFRHLQTMVDSLDASGRADWFEVFVLSDSNDPDVISEEEARFRAFVVGEPASGRIHYRRRARNTGYKAGNVWDFVQSQGERFDFMLVLDADSLMSANAIRRLVQIMQKTPRLGILQPLIVGLPSGSAFARLFQFGMRHGMRVYATGIAWWQGDEGPFWGHNALVRLAPFRRHCALPVLPGNPPLGGHVLCHDLLEAVLLRRAGYEVRLLPLEDGSFEQNPPTLPEYMRRDLRWCQGNMQYFRFLGLPGLRLVGRVQLLLAIMMYLNAPFWLAFLLLGLAQLVGGSGTFAYELDPALGVGLLGFMLGLTFLPKILGVLDALIDGPTKERFGGAGRLTAGALAEAVFAVLIGPLLALAHSIFIVGLGFGRCVRWEAQNRTDRTLRWREALRGLWPQVTFGAAITAYLVWQAPTILPWAAPLILGLGLAPAFARVTASPWLGDLLARSGLCATPEEIRPPLEVARLGALPQTTKADSVTPTLAGTAPADQVLVSSRA